MAAKTALRREKLKEALVDAAEQAIATGGLAALKARDLADMAGCAVGAIYNVFPNLDALVFAVNARTLAAVEAAIAATPRAKAGAGPAGELARLALAYADFAIAHRLRWRALFDHRVAGEDEQIPAWYAAEQARLFGLVEAPIRALRPDMPGPAAVLFARTLFSGVHGIVSLGLDAKLMTLSVATLRNELRRFVEAVAKGLVR